MPTVDMDLERAVERDLEREPGLHRSARGSGDDRLRARLARIAPILAQVDDPPPANRCYACDARAVGTRDRRAEGGRLEQACMRHADTIGGLTP